MPYIIHKSIDFYHNLFLKSKHKPTGGICEMGIPDADTIKNPGYFPFACKKTAHFANACTARKNVQEK